MKTLANEQCQTEDYLQGKLRYNGFDKPSPPVVGRVPGKGTINSLLRKTPQHRLYVRPIAWTSDHLQLLDCRFDFKDGHLEIADEPSQQDLPAHVQDDVSGQAGLSKLSEDARLVKLGLVMASLFKSKKNLVLEILEAYNIPPQKYVDCWLPV